MAQDRRPVLRRIQQLHPGGLRAERAGFAHPGADQGREPQVHLRRAGILPEMVEEPE